MTPFLWPWKAKNLDFCCPKWFVHILSKVKWQKKEEELPQLVGCVWHGYRSKLPSAYSKTHTTMATLLPISVDIPVCSRYETLIWATFLIFLDGLMRLIIKTWTSKMYFVMVETCQIFLSDDYYCKTRFYGPKRSTSARLDRRIRIDTKKNPFLSLR